ncbi:hypothetical protein [Nafulsella turpanensis]|uniref:hypothetical protein n=1 Tax=Nafulsella turpanensis TaxID=1265690 RepID=UPI0003466E49|nr:hypothetical protein [Nafulsella turpanensis]
MIQLTEEIYALLSGVGNTHFNIIDTDVDSTQLQIVYELNEAGSNNTLDTKDYANDVALIIKLLHPDSLSLMGYNAQVKDLFLNHPWEHCRDIHYSGSVPIFPDPDLGVQQSTLKFTLYSDGSKAGLWAYIKATLEAFKERLSQYYTKQEVHDYVATNAPAPDLTGYATETYVQNAVPDNTDGLAEGTTNQYFTEERSVLSKLSGYVKQATTRAIAATDSVRMALGILENKIDSHNHDTDYSSINHSHTAAEIGAEPAFTTLDDSKLSGNVAKRNEDNEFHGSTFVPNPNAITTRYPANWSTNDYDSSLTQQPFGNIWHDLFAFTRFVDVTYETFDGTTWTAAPVDKYLFSQKNDGRIEVVDAALTRKAGRWTFNGSGQLNYSNGMWLVIGHAWTPAHEQEVTFESSTDGITWVVKHESINGYSGDLGFYRLFNYGEHSYYRVTIKHVSGAGISINQIRLLSARPGDQGKGSQHEFPYKWNEDLRMFIESAQFNGRVLVNKSFDNGQALQVNGALHLSTNPLPSTPVDGNIETDGTNLYFTANGVRKQIQLI